MNRSEIVEQALECAKEANPQSEPDYVDGFIAGSEFILAALQRERECREKLVAELQRISNRTGDMDAENYCTPEEIRDIADAALKAAKEME